MPIGEAEQENIYHSNIASTTATHPQDRELMKWLDYMPKPSSDFKCSVRQIEKQVEFYKMKLGSVPINDQVNPYNAKIITLLPPNVSDLFRQIVSMPSNIIQLSRTLNPHCETIMRCIGMGVSASFLP
jgi:hypothetical protein